MKTFVKKMCMQGNYTIEIGKPEIRESQSNLGKRIWPEFIQHDAILEKYWNNLYTDFLDCQFAFYSNNNFIGVGNSIPLRWDDDFKNLPDKGLDWAMEKAVKDIQDDLAPNLLVGVQILIGSALQSKGLSYRFLETMKQIAKNKGFKHIALPVRPNLKHQYPLIAMDDYLKWITPKGEPFDPWIRVHLKAGGKIISICHESMHIKGKINDWEKWTGLCFKSSGNYIVDKALCPVSINIEKDKGVYLEPNVWIVHETT